VCELNSGLKRESRLAPAGERSFLREDYTTLFFGAVVRWCLVVVAWSWAGRINEDPGRADIVPGWAFPASGSAPFLCQGLRLKRHADCIEIGCRRDFSWPTRGIEIAFSATFSRAPSYPFSAWEGL
jgi:hypothetical protein